jgi:hypothetical protein
MNGNDWLAYIKKKRPYYANGRSDLIMRFANKGTTRIDYVQFGPIYQIYMYAFMLGFHQRLRVPLPTGTSEKKNFNMMAAWQPEGMVDYMLMLLISHSPTVNEIELDFVAMEGQEDNLVEDKLDKLVKILEEFANGGFSIIQAKFDSNPQFFSDPFAFSLLLKETVDGKHN